VALGKPRETGPRADTKPPLGTSLSLFVLFLVNVLNFYDRQVLGALTEPLRREFGLSDGQVGALATTFTVVYALAGAPLGRLADRWSRKRLLALGTAVWAALTALGGFARSYPMLLVSRLGVGVGEAVCGPATTSWTGDLAPPERRARALARLMMAVPVGVMLSLGITGPLAQAYGWRTAIVVAALPAVVLIPALLMLREPQRAQARDDGEHAAGAYRTLFANAAFRWMVISGAVVNFVLYSFSTFVPAFLTRFHGLSVAEAGVWSGIGSGVSGILGAWIGGHFGDRVKGHRGRGRMMLAAAAAAASSPLAFVAVGLPAGSVAAAVLLIMAAYGLLQTYYGLVYAAVQDVVAPGLRGTAMGAYFMAMYLCGASFGPLVTGRLSDYFARAAAGTGPVTEVARAVGLREAMFLIPALSAVLAVILWAGGRAAAAVRPQE
jgi:MFS family permease